MKIQKLLEAEFDSQQRTVSSGKEFKDKQYKHQQGQRKYYPTGRSGAFGRVYSIGDPHTVVKRPHAAQEDTDPYYVYAKEVIENKLAQKNPYFPRFFNVKEVKDSENNILYRFEMEKLKSCEEIENNNPEIIKNTILNIFGEDIYKTYYVERESEYHAKFLANAMSVHIVENHADTNDDNFNNAIRLLHRIKEDNEFVLDLHSKNIMFRLSPYPQVVITDPFV